MIQDLWCLLQLIILLLYFILPCALIIPSNVCLPLFVLLFIHTLVMEVTRCLPLSFSRSHFSKHTFLILCPQNSNCLFLIRSKNNLFILVLLRLHNFSYSPVLLFSVGFGRTLYMLPQNSFLAAREMSSIDISLQVGIL